jgi:hypothetical protein
MYCPDDLLIARNMSILLLLLSSFVKRIAFVELIPI